MRSGHNQNGNHITLIINDSGMIHDCDATGHWLLGLSPGKLFKKHISALLPELSDICLMHNGQINPRLRFLSRIGHHFNLIGNNGVCFASRIFIHAIGNSDLRLRMIICP